MSQRSTTRNTRKPSARNASEPTKRAASAKPTQITTPRKRRNPIRRERDQLLQVYLSKDEITAFRRIAARRSWSNARLVRYWIKASQANHASKAAPAAPPDDPRQLQLIEGLRDER